MTSKCDIGDVFEVATNRGLAYIQYSHDHGRYGSLVRVLPGLFPKRRPDLCGLTMNHERFYTFYPVRSGLQLGKVALVAHCIVPTAARAFPLLRHRAGRDPKTREMRWWLWDENGVAGSRVSQLTHEQSSRSIAEICNHAALVDKIESDWAPSRSTAPADSTVPRRRQLIGSRQQSGASAKGQAQFYLYFRNRRTARRAVTELRAEGYAAELRSSADGANCLVLVTGIPAEDIEPTRLKMEVLAPLLRGEYDGWELEQ